MKLLTSLSSGILQLTADPCGALVLLTLTCASVLCYFGKIGDVSFAATVGFMPVVVAALKHKSMTGSDIDNPPPPMPERAQR